LGKRWPALDVYGSETQVEHGYYLADDCGPTAVQDIDGGLRFFFSRSTDRDRALETLRPYLRVSPVDVADEDWARRSQENLTPIAVGRIMVTPPSHGARLEARSANAITIVVQPSMGFGTGHHATTRLCLAALQTVDLTGAAVIDFGTGSGVLAMAAVRLGAADVLCVDDDEDAIRSAMENLTLNPGLPADRFLFVAGDLMSMEVAAADVVLANLTGGLLIRAARSLREAVKPGGLLIVSGLEAAERDVVWRAFEDFEPVAEAEESGWITFTARRQSNEGVSDNRAEGLGPRN
jgi:ribosomal protein L11 methyltransferase